VKFEWGKDSLRIVQIERDARFQGNETNNKLVLDIPVEYVDYHCAQDKYGECTNAEEENHDLTWDQKKMFRIKIESAKSAALELLPILVDSSSAGNLSTTLEKDASGDDDNSGTGKCYEEVSARVLNFQLEPTAMNVDIERTFKTRLECLSQLEQISDATVSAVYHYSMVKADSVTSKNFKAIPYSTEDQNTFGFFTTERQDLDTDNNPTEGTKVTLMNHWNPSRQKIDYYLSDEFNKPENAVIKDLTYKTVDALNDGLIKAGAKFRIDLHEPDHKNPGDIRNSMIILVEDPVASSVIGYGPQTEDPATGEIFSARTVMFLGTIKKYISYTYDEIIREKKRLALEEEGKGQEAKQGEVKGLSTLKVSGQLQQKVASIKSQSLQVKPSEQKPTPKGSAVPSKLDQSTLAGVNQMAKELKTYTKARNQFYSGGAKEQFRYLQEVKNCAFGLNNADMLSAGISPRLAAKFSADAKPWEKLSDSEKQQVIDIILPEVWIPTLIHEMGHNLGLRHNFQGSEDKDNFYSQAELQAMGIDHEIPFSTVMEYGDDLKALPVLGKYDVAALRYGYSRQVELKDGTLVSLENSITEVTKGGENKAPAELKEYGYCTDEHTGINAGCRRFDLGTSYTDIVKNEIQSYMDRYASRNFRHGRANMSLFDDPTYAMGVRSRFEGLRLMQEIYERFKYKFNLSDDSPYWSSVPVLADLKQASQLAAQFLLQVMETPDLTCVVANAENVNEIADVIPLSALDAEQISCFKATINPKFKVIGQYGKLFNSKKDPESTNAYADQIDVRGYWLDKLMASRMLMKRNMGISTLDKNTDSFMDRADIQPLISKSFEDILMNKVVGQQLIELEDGNLVSAELPVDTASSHVIEKMIHPALARFMGLPNKAVSYSEILAKESASYMTSAGHENDGATFADTLKVVRVPTTQSVRIPKGAPTLVMGNDRLIATSNNVIAQKALETRALIQTLDQVKRERLVEIWKAKEDKQPAGEMTKNEQVAWDLDNETLKSYLLGTLGTADFFENLVSVLPN
jgi:hypothetical protein